MTWLTEVLLRVLTTREGEDEGATMLEYGLLVMLIATVVVAAVGPLGSAVAAFFTSVPGLF